MRMHYLPEYVICTAANDSIFVNDPDRCCTCSKTQQFCAHKSEDSICMAGLPASALLIAHAVPLLTPPCNSSTARNLQPAVKRTPSLACCASANAFLNNTAHQTSPTAAKSHPHVHCGHSSFTPVPQAPVPIVTTALTLVFNLFSSARQVLYAVHQ